MNEDLEFGSEAFVMEADDREAEALAIAEINDGLSSCDILRMWDEENSDEV